jgi:4'-phosphopantetheinyl transferase
LSHAGDRALLALTLGHEVGVDIEEQRLIDVLDLACRFFAPSEFQALQALAESERIPAFFRWWTRKEGFIKAVGDGLTYPLDGFQVSLADEDSIQLLRGCSRAPDALACWRIVSVPADSGYVAAVAASSGDWRLIRWTEPTP